MPSRETVGDWIIASTDECGQVVAQTGGDDYHACLTWDEVPPAEDIEIVSKVRGVPNIPAASPCLRVTHRDNTFGGYFGKVVGNRREICKLQGHEVVSLGEDEVDNSIDTSKPHILRLRAEGNGINLRSWQSGAVEPSEWEHTVRDNSIQIGKSGIIRGGSDSIIYFFGVGTEGDRAPINDGNADPFDTMERWSQI